MTKKSPFDVIKNMTAKKNKKLRESLRQQLIRIGEGLNDKRIIEWARNLDDEGIEACLHFGFSEVALFEFLGGTLRMTGYEVVGKIGEPKLQLVKNDKED